VLDRAIALEPSNESMYQHIIPLLVQLGRRDAADQRYKALEKNSTSWASATPYPKLANSSTSSSA
jgi:DNA-binding SARP family transcriptional activator